MRVRDSSWLGVGIVPVLVGKVGDLPKLVRIGGLLVLVYLTDLCGSETPKGVIQLLSIFNFLVPLQCIPK